MYTNVHGSIIQYKPKSGNTQICPSTDKQINKMCYIYSMEHYSAIKRNEVLIHDTTWMNTENMLSERSQTEKTTYCMIPFTEWRNVQNVKICTDGKWINSSLVLGLEGIRSDS